jgi:crotonobetainyl-CoA:carnitine CoA-transferase CaiB-like acyl-CoA transferase
MTSSVSSRTLLERLVEDADVLMENFRPGVLEKWDLGPKRLLEVNHRLVMLRVTGFGQFGPYSKRRTFGTLAEAMSSLAYQTGFPDGPPTLPPFGPADGMAAITGALAIVMALYHRDVDGGKGQGIDVSLIEPLVDISWPKHSHSPVRERTPDVPLDGVMQDTTYDFLENCGYRASGG